MACWRLYSFVSPGLRNSLYFIQLLSFMSYCPCLHWRQEEEIQWYFALRLSRLWTFCLPVCEVRWVLLGNIHPVLPDSLLLIPMLLAALPAWPCFPPAEGGASYSNLIISIEHLILAIWDLDWFLVFEAGCNYETRTNPPMVDPVIIALAALCSSCSGVVNCNNAACRSQDPGSLQLDLYLTSQSTVS